MTDDFSNVSEPDRVAALFYKDSIDPENADDMRLFTIANDNGLVERHKIKTHPDTGNPKPFRLKPSETGKVFLYRRKGK